MTAVTEESRGLRVVAYCVLPEAYGLVRQWAERNGYTLRLVVTTPGPPSRRSAGYREIVAMSPPEQDVLITTRPRRTSPLIAALEPDLVLSFTFPYRLPPEVLAAPRLGAVNLHPTPLPSYRGPNPLRQVYEDAPTIGATLHRTDADFDTGPILSRQERPMPSPATAAVLLPVWFEAMTAALEEGTRRAIAGDPGTPQDNAAASYAAPFTEAERRLDWSIPCRRLEQQTFALNMVGPGALAEIDGQLCTVRALTPFGEASGIGHPGQVLERNGETVTIATGDGAVRVTIGAVVDPVDPSGPSRQRVSSRGADRHHE